MTRSSDFSGGDFGSPNTLTRAEAERREGGRRLADRIAQRDAEARQGAAVPGAASTLLAGMVERRGPAEPDRRRPGDPLRADRLEPLPTKPSYARFIPREEVGAVSTWAINNFGGSKAAPDSEAKRAAAQRQAAERAAAAAARQAAELKARHAAELKAARESGYKDGHRDGLAALDAFKHSHAATTTARMAHVLSAFQAELDQLEQHLAGRVAGIALEVARQVVRQELEQHPQHVVAVTREALDQMLMSARHIAVRLHPDDHEFVLSGVGEALTARHARLIADVQMEPGGCLVVSDIGQVDARVATRWQRAMEASGGDLPWAVTADEDSAPQAFAQELPQALDALPDMPPPEADDAAYEVHLPEANGEPG